MRTIIITTVAILAFAVSVHSMPPRPDAWEATSAAIRARIRELRADAMTRGMDAAGPSVLDNMRRLRRDENAEITLNVAVILVDFDDNEADEDLYPRNHYQEMLFTVDDYETGSMRDWYLENSMGEVHIVGEVRGWYRMPEDYAWYVNGRFGLGAYPHNAHRWAEDAIRAAVD